MSCNRSIVKRKNNMLQEGHRFFWYNGSNRHLSKAACSMEQSVAVIIEYLGPRQVMTKLQGAQDVLRNTRSMQVQG